MKPRIKSVIGAAILWAFATHAFAQGASSPEQLAEAYTAALRAQNQKAFLDLFALSNEQERAVAEQQFRKQSQLRIESIKVVPFAVHEQRYKKAMARLGKSNTVPPEAWAEIAFAPGKRSDGAVEQETTSLAIVRRAGRFYVGW